MSKRVLSLTILSVFVLVCLLGCTTQNEVKPSEALVLRLDNTGLYNGDTKLLLTRHSGRNIIISEDIGPNGCYMDITVDQAKDITNITVNTQKILEENMDQFKDMYYYTEFLGTKMTCVLPLGNEYYSVCQAAVDGQSTAYMAQVIYDYLQDYPVTDNVLKIDCGTFLFGSEWYTTYADSERAYIEDLCQVFPHEIMEGAPEPCTVTDSKGMSKSAKVFSTAAYVYYIIDGYTIQCVPSFNISDVIAFYEGEE